MDPAGPHGQLPANEAGAGQGQPGLPAGAGHHHRRAETASQLGSPQGQPDYAAGAGADGGGRRRAGGEEEEVGQAGGGEGEVGEAGQLDGQGHWPVTGQEGPVLGGLRDQP